MDEKKHPIPRSSSEQLPVNLGASRVSTEMSPDAQWLKQVQERYQFMQTESHYHKSHYLSQLQGSCFTRQCPVTPGMIPPRVAYPVALPSKTGPQGAIPLDAFSSGAIQRASVDLPDIICTIALPGTGTSPLGNISPRMTQGAIPVVGSSTQLPSHTQPEIPHIKQETSTQDPRPSHSSHSVAEVRMHMSELQKVKYPQDLHNKHITWGTALPELSTIYRIPTEVQPTQDVKLACIDTTNSKKPSVASEEQNPESQGKVFLTEIKSRATSARPETCRSFEGFSKVESDDDFTPVLDMSLKNVTSTTQSIVSCTTDSLLKTELNQSMIMIPEVQQVGHHFNQDRTSSKNEGPGSRSVDLDRGRMLIINKVELSDVFTKDCDCESPGSDGKAVSVCVPLTVAEVQCLTPKGPETPTGLVSALENTKSAPVVMLQSLQSQLHDESTETMPSSSKPSSSQHRHPYLPHSGIATDLRVPHKQVSTKLHEPTETKQTPQNRQSKGSESKTSIGEEGDIWKHPPPDNKCPVCEDKVSGYHYGLYSCESCKGFFKRTIHSKRHERLSCIFGGGCVVTLRSRKQCAACRFQKCLSLGMKLEAIRQDRQRGGRSLYQGSSEQRRLIKLKSEQKEAESSAPKKHKRRQLSTLLKDSTDTKAYGSATPLTPRCKSVPLERPQITESGLQPAGLPQLIHDLVEQEESFSQQSVVDQCCLDTLREEKNLLETLCHFVNHQMQPLVKWAKGLPLYNELMIEDQIPLLHGGILSLLCLNLVFYCLDSTGCLHLPQKQVIDLTTFSVAKFNQLVPKIATIAHQLHTMGLDKPRFVCLKLIVLLNSDIPTLKNSEQVQACQETIQDLFFAHITHNQPQNSRVAGNLMLALAAIERVTQQLSQATVYDMEVIDCMFRSDEDTCSKQPWIRNRFV